MQYNIASYIDIFTYVYLNTQYNLMWSVTQLGCYLFILFIYLLLRKKGVACVLSRIKIFSDCVEIFCPTLKIFVCLARPCLAAFYVFSAASCMLMFSMLYVTGFAKTRHNVARTEIHFIA